MEYWFNPNRLPSLNKDIIIIIISSLMEGFYLLVEKPSSEFLNPRYTELLSIYTSRPTNGRPFRKVSSADR